MKTRFVTLTLATLTILAVLTGCSDTTAPPATDEVPAESECQDIDINSALVQKLYSYVDISQFESTQFGGNEKNYYQSTKTTAGSFSNAYKLHAVFYQLLADEKAGTEKEYTVEFLKPFFQESGFTEEAFNNGVFIPTRVYSAEEVEDKFRVIFGSDADITHETVDYSFGQGIYYGNGKYLYAVYMGGGGSPNEDWTYLIKAEENGDYIHLHVKYARFIFEDMTVFDTSDETNTIGALMDWDEREAFLRTNDSVKTFTHTFKKVQDNEYYWVSTEMRDTR